MIDYILELVKPWWEGKLNGWVSGTLAPKVEDALNRAVCDGRVSLAAAQRAIARNWLTSERRLGLSAAGR